MIMTTSTSYAPSVWRQLKGVLCVYKPSGRSEGSVKYAILTKLCRELNQMECRPPKPYVSIEGDTRRELSVKVKPSYADHPLAVGPRYQEEDFRCDWSIPIGFRTSGVFLMGFESHGLKIMKALDKAHQLRTFHVSGQFGRATDTYYTDGRVVERAKFKHVNRHKVDQVVATIQAAHQKSMFELCGVDLQSQDAYELAVQGLVRPADRNVPMIYGIKCVELKPPDFTLEIHSTNETEFYLMSLINEIGMKMHTVAVCTKLRCIRHSYFTLENALLHKHWTLQHVLDNMRDNEEILRNNKDFYSSWLQDAKLYDPRSDQPLIA